MSNRSRQAAPNTGHTPEPETAYGTNHGFRNASASPTLSRFPSAAAPASVLPEGALFLHARRRVDLFGPTGHARFSPNACTAWAAAGAPVFAIDGGVVPPNDVATAAALYLGLHDPAPAGKKTTCTQEGGHVKASSKKIRAPSARSNHGPDPDNV